MSKEQRKLMEDPDRLVGKSDNPLTRLFRLVLRKQNIGPTQWNSRLTTFLGSPFSRVPKNAKDIGQERNNFNRAISRSSMTWKTFQKAIQVIGPRRYRLTIDMEWRDGSTSTVDTGFITNPLADIDKLTNRKPPEELDPTFGDGDFGKPEDEDILDDDLPPPKAPGTHHVN